MDKTIFKGGTMLYPIPAVMVTVGDKSEQNIITVAWTGTINSDPPMAYISVRKERHSYGIIKRTKSFVINLTTEDLTFATDFAGVKSGRDINKFQALGLDYEFCPLTGCPMLKDSPLNIECSVTDEKDLGTHTMFFGKVEKVFVAEKLLDKKGSLNLERADLVAYVHGAYFTIGEKIGKFGFSVAKKQDSKKTSKAKSPSQPSGTSQKEFKTFGAKSRNSGNFPKNQKPAKPFKSDGKFQNNDKKGTDNFENSKPNSSTSKFYGNSPKKNTKSFSEEPKSYSKPFDKNGKLMDGERKKQNSSPLPQRPKPKGKSGNFNKKKIT